MEQYNKKGTEGGSSMNKEKLEELVKKIKDKMEANPELVISQAYLELSREERKEIDENGLLLEIRRIIKGEKKKPSPFRVTPKIMGEARGRELFHAKRSGE